MKHTTSILFLTRLYHPHIGGVEKHVEELSKILLKKGFEVSVITEQYEKDLKLSEIYNGVRIYRIPVGRSIFWKKFIIWKWIFLHLNLFYLSDIVHVHDVFYWVLPVRVFLFFKKFFVTFHGYEAFPIKKRWIIHRKITEFFTSGNICVGDFMKKWYKTNPTAVIYGATGFKYKKTASSPHSAVFFGRLDQQTGIAEYAKAYEILKKKYPDFKFTVVGEGKFESKLPREVKIQKFAKNVEKYIEDNHFIFVSRYLSMLEALSLKKTIIAVYDNEIKKDYLVMSPFKNYVSIAKNEAEIVDFVKFYIENPEKEKILNQKGYEWSKEQTWENLIKVYLRLWELV